MKRGRADEDQKQASERAEEAPAVVAVGAGDASPGTGGARRRTMVSDPADEVAVAVEHEENSVAVDAPAADLQQEVAGDDRLVVLDPELDGDLIAAAIDLLQNPADEEPFKEYSENEYSEEDDAEVDDEKYSRNQKSRHVLKRLKSGQIRFRNRGHLFCPFCSRIVKNDAGSMIQHAKSIGVSRGRHHQPVTKANHLAYGFFLENYYMPGLFNPDAPAAGPRAPAAGPSS